MTTTLSFPLDDLLDEGRCYDLLTRNLHPEGLHCLNGHELDADQCLHTRNRAPVVECRPKDRLANGAPPSGWELMAALVIALEQLGWSQSEMNICLHDSDLPWS